MFYSQAASKEYCVGFRVPSSATTCDRKAFSNLKKKLLDHVQLVGPSGDAHIAALNVSQEEDQNYPPYFSQFYVFIIFS